MRKTLLLLFVLSFILVSCCKVYEEVPKTAKAVYKIGGEYVSPDYDPDDLDNAVVSIISSSGIYLNDLYPEQYSQKDLDCVRKKIADLRKFTETISNQQVKDSYFHWLDVYEKSLVAIENQKKSGAKSRFVLEQEEWDQKQNEKERQAKKLQALLPKIPSSIRNECTLP